MSHFLWVEDFKASETKREDNIISSTVDLVFGSILKDKVLSNEFEDEYDARDILEEQGIFLRLNLLDAFDFIHNPNELAKIDFVVLDVDMPLQRDGQPDKNNYLPTLIEKYKSEAELKKIAGYQIYIDLVIELGYPKSHILFCSNHAGYFEEFTAKFESSNIKFPKLLQKEHKEEIKDWLTEAHSDYFVLRRGIIEGCKQISKNLTEDEIVFNSFISENEKKVNLDEARDYLEVLAKFLPLRKPNDNDKAALYKLFVRTLSHEWEATDPKKIRGLAGIMKNTRNWIVHNSTLFSAMDEKIVAYLFIINMRLMFSFDDAVQNYEKTLFELFSKNAESADVVKNKLFPFDKAYLNLKNRVLDERKNNIQDGFYFNELANNLQQNNSSFRNDKALFTKLLYQMFWLTTSNPHISTGNRRNLLEIKFWDFNYTEKPYIFELAKNIYNDSKPE
jgi:hypothetical protein